jgi:hypothetical protein
MVIVKNMCTGKSVMGGGVIVFYKKWLNPHIEILDCCADSMIWIKIGNNFFIRKRKI